MPEAIQPLNFNPMQAVQMGIQMDSLNLREEGQAIQRQQLMQQGAKLRMEERRNSLKDALPMMPNTPEKVSALNELLNIGSGPDDRRYSVTLDDLHADGALWTTLVTADDEDKRDGAFRQIVERNPKVAKEAMEARTKATSLIGMGTFLEQAGLPNTPQTRAALEGSPAMQKELGQATIETPLDRAKTDEITARVKEKQSKIAGMNVGASILLKAVEPVKGIIDAGDRFSGQLDGLAKSGGKWTKIMLAGNKDMEAHFDELTARVPQVTDELREITHARGALDTAKDLHLLAGEPLPKGETMETMNARLTALNHLRDMRVAEREYALSPSSTTLKTLKSARDAASGQVQAWAGEKKGLEAERIAIAKEGQTLARDRFTTKRVYDEKVATGEADLLDAVRGGEDKDAAAARIARKLNVKPSDIKKSLEDPSRRGTLSLLSPGERNNIAEERTMTQHMDDLLGKFNPEYVGVVDSRITKAGQLTDSLTQERQDWVQKLRMTTNILRHSQFGATLTGYELESAVADLPNEKMGDKQFVASAKAWRNHWGTLIDERMKVAKQSRGAKAATTLPATAEDYLKSLMGVQ